MIYQNFFSERKNTSKNFLNLFKRGMRDRSKLLQYNSLTFMFQLLEEFAKKKNTFSGFIYKILCTTLIENHSNITIREYILKNFEHILTHFESIPLDVLVIPLINIISEKEKVSYHFNVFDFEFFNVVANHPRLSLQIGIEILEIFYKIYFNDIIFSSKFYFFSTYCSNYQNNFY